ncbi:B3 domain-containing protein, partial [Thalictrum thalictroides]
FWESFTLEYQLRSILAGLTELTMHINSFIIFMVYPAFVRPDRESVAKVILVCFPCNPIQRMVKGGTDQIISEDMKQPEFFKIIHASLGNTEQLRIPPEFLKHISDEVSGIAVLEGPSATWDWHVRFCRTEGGTFFTEGWNDFVRDNALGEYEFLVFRYQGNMCFFVEIYAKSGCKKEDSGGNIQHNSTQMFIGSTSYCGRGRPPKNALLSQIRGKVRNGRLPTEEEREKVLKAALSFTSTLRLPNFMRCLYASCVYTSYVLNIPSDFAKAYLPKYKKEIVLQGRSGKSWRVTCNPGKRQYTFCGGWTCFVHENQLNAGDVCVFELVCTKTLRVHIFRIYPTS